MKVVKNKYMTKTKMKTKKNDENSNETIKKW